MMNIAMGTHALGIGCPCPCEPQTQLWTLKTEGHIRTVTLLKVWNKQCTYTTSFG